MMMMMMVLLLMMMMMMMMHYDGDDEDGDDAKKMNGTLSCGGKGFFLRGVPLVSKITIFFPIELRMKHAKSKTVH